MSAQPATATSPEDEEEDPRILALQEQLGRLLSREKHNEQKLINRLGEDQMFLHLKIANQQTVILNQQRELHALNKVIQRRNRTIEKLRTFFGKQALK